MSRKLPRFFAHHFLAEFFLSDPAGVVADLFLEKKLREMWVMAAEELRELALKDVELQVKPLFWRNYRAVLVELAPAHHRGEPRAAVLAYREATKEARVFYQEKAESGWAVTSIGADRAHLCHTFLEQGDSESFVSRARECVGS